MVTVTWSSSGWVVPIAHGEVIENNGSDLKPFGMSFAQVERYEAVAK